MKSKYKKIVEFIKKHDNIFAVMLIFLSIFGITINVGVTNADELWNFQNIYKMYNGFQIYKDANVIDTPLFFWIGELLFKVLGANFLVFRIYNIIIMLILYFVTYLLLKKLGISKKISIIVILILITLDNYGMLLVQANYNTMALMLCITGVLLNINKCRYNTFIQGLILFLIFSTKQNIGVFYGIGLLACEILNNNCLKYKIKNLLAEFLTFLILLISLLIYFYINNNLYNFINYTVLGIREFANENIFVDFSNIILAIFFVLFNIILTTIFIKNKKIDINKIEEEKLIILNCFSLPLTLIMIPIANRAHFLIGIHLSLILFIYLINIMIKRMEFKKSRKAINIILVIFAICTCTNSIVNFTFWTNSINNKNYQFNMEDPFYGGIFKEETVKNIENIVEYIENENENDNIIVLSSKAAFYMIPTHRSNGMMDLPFKGNLGKEGEQGLIEKIKDMDNVKILIEKDENSINWQESKEAREYIIENMEKIGEIEEFFIYKEK